MTPDVQEARALATGEASELATGDASGITAGQAAALAAQADVTAAPSACDAHHCVTCGDDAVPMTVLGVDERRGLALCAAEDDRHETVETALVEPVAPGDDLLVHAGTAIARVSR